MAAVRVFNVGVYVKSNLCWSENLVFERQFKYLKRQGKTTMQGCNTTRCKFSL